MIDALLDSIGSFYRSVDAEAQPTMFDLVVDAVDRASLVSAPTPDPRPVTRHLDGLRSSGHPAADAVLAALVDAAPALPWTQTAGYLDVLPQDYLDNYGYVRLLGPGAVIEHETVMMGVGLWGPDLYYPVHAHPAEELYHVLHGSPQFRSGDGGFRTEPVGAAIHHPSMTPHAMRFGAEPTVLLYAWVGDIHVDAVITEAL